MARGEAPGAVGVEVLAVEEARGSGCGHARSCRARSAGPPIEHEAAVAIAAFDEAGCRVDAQIDARMAERGGNLARAVARDRCASDVDDFGRRNVGLHARQGSMAGGEVQSRRLSLSPRLPMPQPR